MKIETNTYFLFAYRNEVTCFLYSLSLESNWKETNILHKNELNKASKIKLRDHIQNKMANFPMKNVN